MISSIDLFASFKAAKPGVDIKKSLASNFSAEKSDSFRESLKEAGRSYEKESGSIRREMTGRSEAKLSKADNRRSAAAGRAKAGQAEDEKEPKAKQSEKTGAALEELLAALQRLAQVQQDAEQAPENQQEIPEAMKVAFQMLTELQGKLEKLTGEKMQVQAQPGELQQLMTDFKAQLQEVLGRLKAESTGSTDKSFSQKLETAVIEALTGLEAVNPALMDGSIQQAFTNGLGNSAEAAVKKETGTEGQSTEAEARWSITNSPSAEGVDTAGSNQATESKNAKPNIASEAADAEAAEEMTAVEEKTGNTTVCSKESNRHDNMSGDRGEASEGAQESEAPVQARTNNEGVVPVNLEQALPADNTTAVSEHAEAPRSNTASRTEIINQIVKKAEIVLTDAQSEMRMQLEPENLGKLTLKVVLERGLVTAKFTAESQEVKQVLESSFNELKDILHEKGLAVQSFSVSVGHENREYHNNSSFQQWKETVKLNGSTRNRGSYDGYYSNEAETPRVVNPYMVHNGEFDHMA